MEEAHRLSTGPSPNHFLEPNESSSADEQDIGRVHRSELLVRVLASALGRDVRRGSLEDLQQSLLHTLARHVPGDRRVLVLAADLVDLVYIDYPLLAARSEERRVGKEGRSRW